MLRYVSLEEKTQVEEGRKIRGIKKVCILKLNADENMDNTEAFHVVHALC